MNFCFDPRKVLFHGVCFSAVAVLLSPAVRARAADPLPQKDWPQTLLAARTALCSGTANDAHAVSEARKDLLARMETEFPEQWDWLLQDAGGDPGRWLEKSATDGMTRSMLQRVLKELGGKGSVLQARFDRLATASAPPEDRRWLELYQDACLARRGMRLACWPAASRKLVFTKHFNLGGSHYAYTEALSDALAERNFVAGSALCQMELDGAAVHTRTLLEDKDGVIRDPAASYDGKRILFSWKKSGSKDDYHLYEMEAESGKVRQLTFGLGAADYEGTYLPNGDLLFNSTRCVQTVDCWSTEVSNLYTCDKDGRFLRRLTFDQVHDNYPTVLDDGRVIYTRWDYNDRGQIFPQPLFQMNSDGTGQTEFYGNNSWFPTTILHARGIPGTQKVLAVASGHHCMQAGKLIVIDPAKGRQEAEGVQLIAPVRETVAGHIDAYGQEGELFQYPCPLSEGECVVSYHPVGWPGPKERFVAPHFKIYWMAKDGRRELLASAPAISCNQPVVLAARPVPLERAGMVDYRKTTGTFYMQNVYAGKALPAVAKGTVKRLRVVALDFRAAPVGHNGSSGPAGGAMSSTPPSIDNGAWDPKIVLGDATVYDDGSAFFQAPARTPLYFQALDAKGRAVQTMRSWSTLQPGENASCVGCHEDKNSPALATRGKTLAIAAGAQRLIPFYGPPRGFSFSREIQPILDRNCVGCHHDRSKIAAPTKTPYWVPASDLPPAAVSGSVALSLLGESTLDPRALRFWSDAYLTLTGSGKSARLVNWIGTQSIPPMLPPYFAGAATSSLIAMLEKGHRNVKLTGEEMDKLACWIDLLVPFCGDYTEAGAWPPDLCRKYDQRLQKRRRSQEAEREQIAALIAAKYEENAPVRVALLDASGNAVAAPRACQPGDRIEIAGPPHLMVRLSKELPECLVYSPEGRVEFPVPVGEEAKAYPPLVFGGEPLLSARPATQAEIAAYRNLAVNPYDVRGNSTFFPHATSNSECRNEGVFAARNAIDGVKTNLKHGGWPNQSWGPEKRTDLWWRVDFGRLVDLDKLVVFIRADFPHDQSWTASTVRFSDGSTEPVELRKSADPQEFRFKKRTTSWVQLEALTGEKPVGWRALTEVEVYGQETVEGGPLPQP